MDYYYLLVSIIDQNSENMLKMGLTQAAMLLIFGQSLPGSVTRAVISLVRGAGPLQMRNLRRPIEQDGVPPNFEKPGDLRPTT